MRIQVLTKILKLLLALYVVTASWNSVLHFGSIFSLSVILSFLLIFLCAAYLMQHKLKLPAKRYEAVVLFPRRDIYIFALFCVFLISANLSHHSKALNSIGLFLVAILGYYAVKFSGVITTTHSTALLRANALGVFSIVTVVVADHLLYNYAGFDIQSIIPRAHEATATFAGGAFRRSYGLSSEPTILAYYFNTLGPLALAYMAAATRSLILKVSAFSLFAAAFIFTFSPTVVLILLATIIFYLFKLICEIGSTNTRSVKFGGKALIFGICLSILFFVFIDDVYEGILFLDPYINKLTLNEGGVEGTRSERWATALGHFMNSSVTEMLFGSGLGYYSSVLGTSPVNWYLMLLIEAGIVGLIVFLAFIAHTFFAIFRSSVNHRAGFAIGWLAGSGHMATMSMYWYPFMWILAGLFCISMIYEKR